MLKENNVEDDAVTKIEGRLDSLDIYRERITNI